MSRAGELDRLRAAVAAVPDPELPMLTIAELGILRDVRLDATGAAEVDLTPTYSGCPAVAAIRTEVRARAAAAGFDRVRVRTVLAPAWSTEEITHGGRAKLAAAGIAPPRPSGPPAGGPRPVELSVRCPRCGAGDTRLVSRFGPTACTALRVCPVCTEPFEHLKEL